MIRFLHRLLGWRVSTRNKGESDHSVELMRAMDSARREWAAAESYFKMVSQPELVDHAVFLMEAAKRRYEYLLRLAREQRINAHPD
ncbi:MAG: DUF2508 family protein [Bacillota bacterium]